MLRFLLAPLRRLIGSSVVKCRVNNVPIWQIKSINFNIPKPFTYRFGVIKTVLIEYIHPEKQLIIPFELTSTKRSLLSKIHKTQTLFHKSSSFIFLLYIERIYMVYNRLFGIFVRGTCSHHVCISVWIYNKSFELVIIALILVHVLFRFSTFYLSSFLVNYLSNSYFTFTFLSNHFPVRFCPRYVIDVAEGAIGRCKFGARRCLSKSNAY